MATPNGTQDVAAAVRSAAEEDLRVRMVGTGHSFTDVAVTDGVLLAPTAMTRVRSIDHEAGLVTVEAGLPLDRLNTVLAEHGLALANMGDIAVQTVAGAVQTSTHGTGRDSGGLGAQVRGLELVLADGSILTCSESENAELFQAARVGLGAFAVVTAVTLAVVPAFLLRAREEPMKLDRVLAELPRLRADNEHFEFFWFPHTSTALTKRNNRAAGPAEPLSAFQSWLDDEFLSNTLFDALNRVAKRAPASIPAINQLSARALSARSYADASHKVFASPRRVKFVETEYAVPAECAADVLGEIRTLLARRDYRISFPVEVRFTPADDVWLSTAHGRDTAYIAAHVYKGVDHTGYFADLEAIFTAVGGRPHWGKLHTRERDYLETVYPKLADALVVRDRVDPERRFANAYLERVLGG